MTSSFRLAGAAALCAALLLSACAKKTTDQTTTTTTTDTAQAGAASTAPDASASTAPDATASSAPDAAATTAAASTTTTTTDAATAAPGASDAYIDIPVYPGAANNKDEGMTASGSGGSVDTKVYTSKDDAKLVTDWYKAHLPASWQNSVITAGGKTVGTFVDEHKDGDQSVMVTNQDDGTTRMQLTTKHGK